MRLQSVLHGLTACLVLALVASIAAGPAGAAPTGTAQYGPCCPITHGDSFKGNSASEYWGLDGRQTGPRFTCLSPERISLRYGDKSFPVYAVEASGSLLIPAQTFRLIGASVEWSGGRALTASLGPRSLALTLGGHEVGLREGGNTTQTSWELCPRLRNDVAYVPLRPMAEALGLSVAWAPGEVTLAGASGARVATDTAAECPASKLDAALGIVAARGEIEGPFGPGVGILEVHAGGNGEKMGLQPKDVILAAGGTRVTCPRDLEAIIAQNQSTSTLPCAITVVRGGVKTNLRCAAHN
jgi:hypothetical protein